jgi:hypothetical protein
MLFRCLAALLLSLAFTASAGAETVVTSTGEYPAIAVTGRGDFIAVWQEVANPTRVFARLYGANGAPKGPAFLVHDDATLGYNQAVAAGPAGRFVVVWTADDGDQTGVFAQRFNRNGKKLGGRIQVNSTTVGWQDSPAVAMGRDGSFVVAWRDSPIHPSGIKAQRFSAAGTREGAELAMDLQKAPYSGPFVAVDPEGFSIGWTERTPPEDRHDKRDTVPVVARFTPEGQPVAAPDFRLSDGVDDGNGWTLNGLDSSAAGAVALLGGNRNSVQLFSPDGDPAGPRAIVGKRAPCLPDSGWCENVLTTAMDSSGRFVIVWAVSRTQGTGSATTRRSDLLAQLFDAEGRPLGGRVQVNRDYEGRLDGVAALSDDGVLTILWGGRRPNSSEDTLVFRQVRLQ